MVLSLTRFPARRARLEIVHPQGSRWIFTLGDLQEACFLHQPARRFVRARAARAHRPTARPSRPITPAASTTSGKPSAGRTPAESLPPVRKRPRHEENATVTRGIPRAAPGGKGIDRQDREGDCTSRPVTPGLGRGTSVVRAFSSQGVFLNAVRLLVGKRSHRVFSVFRPGCRLTGRTGSAIT